MDVWLRAVAVMVVAVLGLLILIACLGFFVSIRPPRYYSARTPADLGWQFERVALRTSDGLTLSGWYIPRAGGSDGRRAVVVLHGYPFSKNDILGVTPFIHQRYDLLLFDFRYFGESQGSITTVGHREWQDLLAAIEYLKGRGVESIGVWGFSLGAAVGLMALTHTSDIRAVVADSAYSDLHEMTLEYYGSAPIFSPVLALFTDLLARTLIGASPRDVSPLDAARRTEVPLLLIHGADDRTISARHFERFRNALHGRPNTELWLVEKASHGMVHTVEGPTYQARMLEFFGRHLGG